MGSSLCKCLDLRCARVSRCASSMMGSRLKAPALITELLLMRSISDTTRTGSSGRLFLRFRRTILLLGSSRVVLGFVMTSMWIARGSLKVEISRAANVWKMGG